MKELVTINCAIAKVLSEQGHQDLLLVASKRFAIQEEAEALNISLNENNPMVLTVLAELKRCFPVEKMTMANQGKEFNFSLYAAIYQLFGENTPIETNDHAELEQLVKAVRSVI